jgi:hypothetical protein
MSAVELMLALRAGLVPETIALLLAMGWNETAQQIAKDYNRLDLLPVVQIKLADLLPDCPELQIKPLHKIGIWQS